MWGRERIRHGVAIAGWLLLAPLPAAGETLTLRWRHPTPDRVAGFRLHVGTARGEYTQTVDVGLPRPDAAGIFRAPLEVDPAAPLWVVVTAYDGAGLESLRSEPWTRAPALPLVEAPGRPRVVDP